MGRRDAALRLADRPQRSLPADFVERDRHGSKLRARHGSSIRAVISGERVIPSGLDPFLQQALHDADRHPVVAGIHAVGLSAPQQLLYPRGKRQAALAAVLAFKNDMRRQRQIRLLQPLHIAGIPVSAVGILRRTADKGNAAAAESVQMGYRLPAPCGMISVCRPMLQSFEPLACDGVGIAGRLQLHQRLPLSRNPARTEHDAGIRLAGSEQAGIWTCISRLPEDQQQIQPPLAGRKTDTAEQLREVEGGEERHVRHERQHDAQVSAPLLRELPGDVARHITQRVRRLQHLEPGCLLDRPRPAQHPRHGRLGYARELGDFRPFCHSTASFALNIYSCTRVHFFHENALMSMQSCDNKAMNGAIANKKNPAWPGG
ncbi:hypothetical protein BN871_KA_00100 [Paenibacillus sp. P22]|nr:hypothetical protein BN871_KA_00100 [Paenibacillus sp. P22]